MQSTINFKETQQFTQWWIWLLLGGLLLIVVYGLFQQIILGKTFGDNPMPNGLLILFSLLFFGLIAMIRLIKLRTEIDENEIRMCFFPFTSKNIAWKDVKSVKVVKYGFVGWGVRVSLKYGMVYNVKGNKGLAIELLNGYKILIGTQKTEELRKVLDKIL